MCECCTLGCTLRTAHCAVSVCACLNACCTPAYRLFTNIYLEGLTLVQKTTVIVFSISLIPRQQNRRINPPQIFFVSFHSVDVPSVHAAVDACLHRKSSFSVVCADDFVIPTQMNTFHLVCRVMRKVAIEDLTAGGDSSLAGYWGGFSGEIDGHNLGFLSPLFNGEDFHGNAVQVGCFFFFQERM